MAECKEVIHEIKRHQHTIWRIEVKLLSSQSLLTLLTDINECRVRSLSVYNSHFDNNCVSQLSHVVTFNRTMEVLHLYSSPLLPDTYHFLASALTGNKKMEALRLWFDNNITDKDIPHFCHIITNNKTLKVIDLFKCPNITKFGEQQLQNICVKNNNLKSLSINGNVLCYRY